MWQATYTPLCKAAVRVLDGQQYTRHPGPGSSMGHMSQQDRARLSFKEEGSAADERAQYSSLFTH